MSDVQLGKQSRTAEAELNVVGTHVAPLAQSAVVPHVPEQTPFVGAGKTPAVRHWKDSQALPSVQ